MPGLEKSKVKKKKRRNEQKINVCSYVINPILTSRGEKKHFIAYNSLLHHSLHLRLEEIEVVKEIVV